MKVHKKKLLLVLLIFLLCSANAQQIISENKLPDYFAITSSNSKAIIYADDSDFTLIKKSALLLQQDIESVTSNKPELVNTIPSSVKNIIIIGSVERSSLIKKLIQQKKINIDKIKNKWEAYQLQTIESPFKGIENALIIAGSDRRGTAYGVFEISQQIGVSPWYWWADVPVKRKKEIYIKRGIAISDSPKVKYRGIFINDEAPALSGWTKEKFGGFNHLFYEKVFELMLRLKANYLWPAMWGNAFYDDDTLNKKTADDYGIVIGTSHHEPLMRAHDEWRRYGSGKWNYDSNEIKLKSFWREGMQRVQGTETIVSIGMRGDGDEPMTQGTAIALLERIVKDQRQIISDVTKKDAAATPQLWALYKEVQEYYDKGMRVPDDVTLLLCDDNWGNIRKLPKLNESKRKGGYGIYYHFDYVGDPRNYKWINTNNISRVWEQMHLAYEYQVDKIWIVNVGDIKPMEFPISFFLDYAWNPHKWNEDNLMQYYTNWSVAQFGEIYAKQIGNIIQKYSQYNARRKPELLSPETYSLFNYNEANNVVNDYNKLVSDAEKINQQLPEEYKDAFFELVLHPVRASANLNELYVTVAKNRWFASQKSAAANKLADKAKEFYLKDSLISLQYNKTIANCKWNHMMDQTHIGYTYWQQPETNKMPEVYYVSQDSVLDQGTKVDVKPKTAESFIPANSKENIFYEQDGYVSLQAEHFSKAINTSNIKWKIIPGVGRDGSGITTFPVTASAEIINEYSPHVEYDFFVYDSGQIKLSAYFSPTLNFQNDEGLRYAVSIDDEQPQIISINKEDKSLKQWQEWVANNVIVKSTEHPVKTSGKHILKYWMISPAVVLNKLLLSFDEIKPSYLGPEETLKTHY